MRERVKPAVLFPRPTATELAVERAPVGGRCPSCERERVERYRLLRVTGWAEVTRCQDCLHILDEKPAPTPFGFTYAPYGSYLRDSSG